MLEHFPGFSCTHIPAQSPSLGVSAALPKFMVTNLATQAKHGNGRLGESKCHSPGNGCIFSFTADDN